jgi:CYTH domain-containing protein
MGDQNPALFTVGLPKYARMEYERRFLVDSESSWQSDIKPYSKRLEDRYLSCGRQRVRKLVDSDTGRVDFKLTKKYESDSTWAQPIVSTWLSAAEYDALSGLPGYVLSKTRHYHDYEGATFAIDVFHGDLSGLILCEAELESLDALLALRLPPYARWEVTSDACFTGASLCRLGRCDLESMIKRVRTR